MIWMTRLLNAVFWSGSSVFGGQPYLTAVMRVLMSSCCCWMRLAARRAWLGVTMMVAVRMWMISSVSVLCVGMLGM